jgi:membrane protein YqaA with SNARE-associated domain
LGRHLDLFALKNKEKTVERVHESMASSFSGFVDFVGVHSHYAFASVFLLALSEAIPVIGTVVPGSTLIVAISALATGADVNPWFLLVAATVGAIVGDGLSFWLGARYHGEILFRWPVNRYPGFIERSKEFINRYGATGVFLARLMPASNGTNARTTAVKRSVITVGVAKKTYDREPTEQLGSGSPGRSEALITQAVQKALDAYFVQLDKYRSIRVLQSPT